jgi:hypothetical protein
MQPAWRAVKEDLLVLLHLRVDRRHTSQPLCLLLISFPPLSSSFSSLPLTIPSPKATLSVRHTLSTPRACAAGALGWRFGSRCVLKMEYNKI